MRIASLLLIACAMACANGTETPGSGGYTYTADRSPDGAGSTGGSLPTISGGGTGGTSSGGSTGTSTGTSNALVGVTVAAGTSQLCMGADNQNHLQLVACGSGALQFALVQGQWRAAGMCLDLADASAPDNTALLLKACGSQSSQLWTYDRGYLFATNAPGASKCVYLSTGLNAGSVLQVRSCDINGQLWTVAPEGMQIMASAGSSRCLAVEGANSANGTAVQVLPCNGSGGQLWTYEAGRLRALKLGQKCLDLPNNDPTAGAALQLYDCNGAAQQSWFWEGADGSLRAEGVTDRCVRLGSAANGGATPAVVDSCAGLQDWTVSKP